MTLIYKSKPKGYVRLTDDVATTFLNHLAETGRFCESAAAAGTSYETVRRHRKENKLFAEACDEALSVYRDLLAAEIDRRGRLGWDEPVYFQGRVVGSVRKYDSNLLLAQAKAHLPEYREKSTVDINAKVGVLVVGAPAQDGGEWEKMYGGPKEVPKELPSKVE